MHPVHMIHSGPRTQDIDPGSGPVTRQLSAAEIADDIRDRIRRGEYPPGSKLPSYTELAALYTVHTATIQRAMTVLRARGDVYGHPGRGVFVPDADDA
jgi:GntR family transcriptional regulator